MYVGWAPTAGWRPRLCGLGPSRTDRRSQGQGQGWRATDNENADETIDVVFFLYVPIGPGFGLSDRPRFGTFGGVVFSLYTAFGVFLCYFV